MKLSFSTGDAAAATHLSQQTIIRSIDTGILKGYRVPNSKFRRVSRAALIAFMNEYNIPIEFLEAFDIKQAEKDEAKQAKAIKQTDRAGCL